MAKQVGVLVPLFSLPGEYGIGDIDSLYKFVDKMANLNVQIIQLLPMNAVSEGETSPYSSISSFAINPLYISLDRLPFVAKNIEKAIIIDKVDYKAAYRIKFQVFNESWQGFLSKASQLQKNQFKKFKKDFKKWLEPYTIFHCLMSQNKKAFWDWDESVQNLIGGQEWYKENSLSVDFFAYLQWITFTQWKDLKSYAQEKKVKLMGDLPLYVSKNSSDYWSRPKLFKKGVHAGVPPDMYSEDGQDWGNPIYDWEVMKKDKFLWWKERITWMKEFFDLVRIDHVRGLYSYWEVPDGSLPKDVKDWTPGPGAALFESLKETGMELIGEDLGDIPKEVEEWMKKIKLPGYKVFLFGWGEYKADNYRFIENYPKNTLACTSTHDSESYWEFLEALTDEQVYELGTYLGIKSDERFTLEDIRKRSIKKLLNSKSDYVIIPLQDILAKGIRINLPGSISDENWSKLITIEDSDKEKLNEFSQWITEIN